MKRKKNHLTTILLLVVLFAGFSLLLYPTVSDYYNSLHQSRAISTYAEDVAEMNNSQYEAMFAAAQTYNRAMLQREKTLVLEGEEEQDYNSQLNVSDQGIMGYIEIPEIKVSLPIYHGTDESVLQRAIGHLEWSSLPVGGESSHCVLSGHRGLPSANLFTNLDQLREGDVFMLRVLDEVLTYEVDQILIVEPHETSALQIVEGEDYCTLVTCTPHGVNSHRLLVRGHRIENIAESKTIRVTADALQIEPLLVAPVVAMPMLLVLLIILLIPKKHTGYGGDSDEDI